MIRPNRPYYSQAWKALEDAYKACFNHPDRDVLGMSRGPFSGVNDLRAFAPLDGPLEPMRKPEIIDVISLVTNPHGVSVEWTLPDGRKWWGPARAYGYNQLNPLGRLKAAWMVFTGRADALVWPFHR